MYKKINMDKPSYVENNSGRIISRPKTVAFQMIQLMRLAHTDVYNVKSPKL